MCRQQPKAVNAGRAKAKNEPFKKKGKKTTGEVLSMCIA